MALALFYNAHSGKSLPSRLRLRRPLPSPAQIRWRLSVLASQVTRFPYRPLVDQIRLARSVQHQRPAAGPGAAHAVPRHGTSAPCLPGPTVLTVHDLIFERYPVHHTRRNMWYLRVAMPIYVRAATAIIAVSKQTKRDLCELYGTPAAKIHVVYKGIDAAFAPAPPGEVERARRCYIQIAPICSWSARWSHGRTMLPP